MFCNKPKGYGKQKAESKNWRPINGYVNNWNGIPAEKLEKMFKRVVIKFVFDKSLLHFDAYIVRGVTGRKRLRLKSRVKWGIEKKINCV